jgi:hypothetical protein
MNIKGKEHTANKIIKMIKVMLDKNKSAQMEMKYKDDLERVNNETEGETINTETKTSQDNLNSRYYPLRS